MMMAAGQPKPIVPTPRRAKANWISKMRGMCSTLTWTLW
jgi:hypothetical protein